MNTLAQMHYFGAQMENGKGITVLAPDIRAQSKKMLQNGDICLQKKKLWP